MVNPIGQNQARDAYLNRADQAQVVQRADAGTARPDRRVTTAVEEDSVEISEGLRTMRKAVDAVKNSADVRAERVAQLRQQIEAGEYNVSSYDVAARMLGSKLDVTA